MPSLRLWVDAGRVGRRITGEHRVARRTTRHIVRRTAYTVAVLPAAGLQQLLSPPCVRSSSIYSEKSATFTSRSSSGGRTSLTAPIQPPRAWSPAGFFCGAGSTTVAFLDRLDLARPPGLVEERRQRAVEPQDREPALARVGLDPVAALDALGLRRAEVDRRRAVRGRRRRPATDSSGCRHADSAAASRASSASGCRRAVNDQNAAAGMSFGSVTL